MKNQCHLFLIAIIAISVASCSKSTNDLVAYQNELKKETPKELARPAQGKNPTIEGEISEASGSFVFPVITEPTIYKLGDMNSNLNSGTTAVFYVRLTGAFANDPASSATLTTIDTDYDIDIMSYNLYPAADAVTYGVLVPIELVGQPFMFAIVELDAQYIEKKVSLRSEVIVNESTTMAWFNEAFIVRMP